jgi:hypothetical protein
MSEPRKSRRRWFQYSLRSLMLVMLFTSLGMSWFAVRMKRAREQKAAVEEIRKLGGLVAYEYHGPAWLQSSLGVDFFGTVCGVSLVRSPVTDAGLERLKGLTQLQMLTLEGPQITDGGLENLEGMSQLESLCLSDTKVTDAGLKHLRVLTKLQTLYLKGTLVTDAGLEHLEGLTQLPRLWLNRTRVTDAGLDHLKGLTQLRWLDLSVTRVTDEGVKRLQQVLPNCKIDRLPNRPPTAKAAVPG